MVQVSIVRNNETLSPTNHLMSEGILIPRPADVLMLLPDTYTLTHSMRI